MKRDDVADQTFQTKKQNARPIKGRDTLLLVAMQLFSDRGFDGVTVRDIAKDAKVSIGLINHHFGSKEGLRREVDSYFLDRTSKAIGRAVEVADVGDFDQIARYQREWIVRAEAEWPSFVAYLRRAILDNTEWGQSLFEKYYALIENMLQHSDKAGRIDDNVDREWMTLIYLFILLGPIVLDPHIQAMRGKSTYEPDTWVRFQKQLSHIFWKGVEPRGRK